MTLDVPRTAEPFALPGRVARVAQPSTHWAPSYRRRVIAVDVCAVLGATLLAYLLRFGPSEAHPVQSAVLLAIIPVAWFAALFVFRAYESRFMGLGNEEYDRVLRASTFTLALVGTTSWAFRLEIARGYVIIAIPLGTCLLMVLRYAVRQWLHGQRSRGLHMQSVLVVGHREGTLAMVRQISRASYHGMRVAGVCLPASPTGRPGTTERALAALDVPVLGELRDAADVALREGVDAVAVLPTPEVDGAFLRRLGWVLEETHAELYVAPAITEVVGPRVAIRPVCGLPLLHLERPELTGFRRLVKATFDRVASAAGILVLLPVLVGIAVAVRLDSKGPVFFRQERVGLGGKTFQMLKFRSMVVDAEARLQALAASSEGNEVLFKMKHDPRVTRVGAVLRRLSLDELPQLLNVLRGDMSLVGPRPPLAREVAVYGDDARRKLVVKPGLTGLWQINGRSDLDWDESVRLDLRYVENWSFGFDFMILWKTFGAVVRSRGAY